MRGFCAVAWALKGDYERAMRDYAGAIQLDPKSSEAHPERGIARFEQGRFDAAVVDFADAVALNDVRT
jgi:Flp pilus assembly protein TadD